MNHEIYEKVQQAVDKAMLEELEELTLAEESQIIFDLYKEMANISEISAADQQALVTAIKNHKRL